MYLTLYRKYRPQIFSDMIGQEHITKTLINQITLNRVAHAYLFTGGRGTGKTTAAKIFARAINCDNPNDGKPCGECTVCKQTEDGASINIIELDAASHNGVEDIRQINDEVRYTPTVGKYKVYIIDEVHMLSTAAFNAMLKTLEEPPAYVVFILATTDPQKIPATILSRCQRFDFRRISTNNIKDCLFKYMKQENIHIEEDALEFIARLADGGMRDALSILEQCISFYIEEKEKITLDKVLYLVGAVDNSLLFELVDSIVALNVTQALKICDEVNQQGRNIKQFTKDLLLHARNLLIAKIATNTQGILDYTKEHIEQLKHQANLLETESIFRYIKSFTELDLEMKYSTNPRITLEIAIIKLCTPETDLSENAIYDRVRSLEIQLEELKKNKIQIVDKAPKESHPTNLPIIKADSKEYQEFLPIWERDILPKLGEFTQALFKEKVFQMYIENNTIYIIQSDGSTENIAKERVEKIKEVIINVTGKEYNVQPRTHKINISSNISQECPSQIGGIIVKQITKEDQ
ncbi:DNA polymerase III subunit gamma/tau [Candidatus Epulonipiscioides gigas]|nr:DNA polymerase III subunit gamma/tau [Epulopiscium sp. SCG-C07WGA-EpuloA2]